MPTLLIVEDEEILGKEHPPRARKLSHREPRADLRRRRRLFSELNPDLTLMDLRLPDGSGLDLLAKLRAQSPSSQMIMMTAHATIEDAVRAIKLGAVDLQPLHADDLHAR